MRDMGVTLLGSPVGNQAFTEAAIKKKVEKIREIFSHSFIEEKVEVYINCLSLALLFYIFSKVTEASLIIAL